eukprot:3766377-Amphidinium_carterae.1
MEPRMAQVAEPCITSDALRVALARFRIPVEKCRDDEAPLCSETPTTEDRNQTDITPAAFQKCPFQFIAVQKKRKQDSGCLECFSFVGWVWGGELLCSSETANAFEHGFFWGLSKLKVLVLQDALCLTCLTFLARSAKASAALLYKQAEKNKFLKA